MNKLIKQKLQDAGRRRVQGTEVKMKERGVYEQYELALDKVLKSNSLTDAKEIAAEALDVEADEYMVEELDLDDTSLTYEDFEDTDQEEIF